MLIEELLYMDKLLYTQKNLINNYEKTTIKYKTIINNNEKYIKNQNKINSIKVKKYKKRFIFTALGSVIVLPLIIVSYHVF